MGRGDFHLDFDWVGVFAQEQEMFFHFIYTPIHTMSNVSGSN